MIAFEEALSIVLAEVQALPVTRVALTRSRGYVLARPACAPFPLPHFDNSAMDGFGVRVADVAPASPEAPVHLGIRSTVRAGDVPPDEPLPAGQAVKILTGAPVPTGVEAVVVKEDTGEQDSAVWVKRAVKAGANIRRAGEEFREGDVVLQAGTRITPPVVGLLATLGCDVVSVRRKPKVAVVVTGDELVSPGHSLRPGQIYDANSYSLAAAIEAFLSSSPTRYTAQDDPQALQATLAAALTKADVILTLGGVSVGEYDFVRDVAKALGIATHFWQVAIKPGKPTYFGTLTTGPKRRYLFGLPGNPVAVLVTFHQFVKPALLKMLGARQITPCYLTAELGAELKKKPGRLEFVRGILSSEGDQLIVYPTTGQDSHMLGGLAQADCLIHFPAKESVFSKGESVRVEMLEWS